MERIILIETSTALCSTALAENGTIVSYRESSAPKAHASLTAVFIQDMLQERGLSIRDCDAVCVSMGPGSYTGLRVGVSTAKGLCFGAGIPLLAVGTLDTLVAQASDIIAKNIIERSDIERHVIAKNDSRACPERNRKAASPDIATLNITAPSSDVTDSGVANLDAAATPTPLHIVPMIDARRMEVYTATFARRTHCPDSHQAGDHNDCQTEAWKQITETAPMIIDDNSFADILDDGPVLFIGDGAGKCADVIKHPDANFLQCHPKASAMLAPALTAYKEKRFEDVAYFEPFYLKEFVATVSKKKLW